MIAIDQICPGPIGVCRLDPGVSLILLPNEVFMPDFDMLIRGGIVVDGTQVPRYRADLGIKDGKIAKIGRLNRCSAAKELDASGLIVAPGAIDLHTHYDAPLHWDPYCTIGGWHGVTTNMIGNCGFGFAPVRAKDIERSMLTMQRNEAIPVAPMRETMPFDWETLPQWMDHLDRMDLGVNIAQLVPVSPLVAYVMGGFDEAKSASSGTYDSLQPNENQMQELLRLLDEALRAGALGWSAQRLNPKIALQTDFDGSPMVSDVLTDAFYLRFAEAMSSHPFGFIQFTQISGDFHTGVKNDFHFNVDLARKSFRPVLYNAIAINDKYTETFRNQLKWLDEANREGIRVFAQCQTVRMPMTFSLEEWNFFDNNPLWRQATVGNVPERIEKLSNPDTRAKMRTDYDRKIPGNQPGELICGDFEDLILQFTFTEAQKKFEGMSIGQISKQTGKHPVDVMLDVSLADGLRSMWDSPKLNENPEYLRDLMKNPATVAGMSDGGAHTKFVTTGIWPTDLLTFVCRDNEMISLEEAHNRLSGMPAWVAGITDRGVLREGYAADLMIYDFENLGAGPVEIANDVPCGEWRRIQKAEGYRWILVNGEVTFEDGKCTQAKPGALLRGGSA